MVPAGRPYWPVDSALQYRLRSNAICSKVTRLSVWTISSSLTVLTSVVDELRRPLRLSSVTLFLPDANARHELATCCLDITALPYTSNSCRFISPTDTSCAHKKHITPCISKRDQFAKWVTTLNRRSCAPAAHMPRTTWTWIQPCAVCINDIRNLYAFGATNNRPCEFFSRVHINSKNEPVHIHPSVHMYQLGSHWTNFREIWHWERWGKYVEKLKIWLQQNKYIAYFIWRHVKTTAVRTVQRKPFLHFHSNNNGFLMLTATSRSTKITGNALLRFHGNNGCANVSECYAMPILFDQPSHIKRRYPEISHVGHSLLES